MALPELQSKWRPLAAAVATVLVAALAAGCGQDSSGSADLVNGKKLFTSSATCGSCHTLARAGTKGTQGPNLDEAFHNARENGFGDSVIEGVVRDQIAHPRRASIMKPGLVTGDDARDVAAYVASVAGQPGKDVGQLATIGATASSKPIPAKGGVLTMPANPQGRTLFASTAATAAAGSLQLVMPNPSSLQHDIALKADEGKGPEIGKGAVVGQGGTSKFTANLKPGKYEFLCTVPGHEAGGMKGILTVK